MRIGILTIGNELISGRTQDTNTSHIARELNIQGWQVPILMSVDDDEAAIKTALDHILAQTDAVIVTGGLGPTTDDKTTAAVARAYGLKLYRDEAILSKIRAIFDRYGLYWAPNNDKQADFPEGAEPIVNPVGTAWGFSLNVQDKLIAVLPGVPAEMKRMLSQGVLPVLRRTFPEAAQAVATRTLKLSGISEAEVDQRLADADLEGQGVAVGFYPHFPELRVVLTVRKPTDAEAQGLLKNAENQVLQRLERHIFAYDQETLEGTVAALLTKRKLTLSIAESCTGGLIFDRLTDISGSSVFLERGAVKQSRQDGAPRRPGRDAPGTRCGQRAYRPADGGGYPEAGSHGSRPVQHGHCRTDRRKRGEAGGHGFRRPCRRQRDPLPEISLPLGTTAG